jgi:hypothetical protein
MSHYDTRDANGIGHNAQVPRAKVRKGCNPSSLDVRVEQLTTLRKRRELSVTSADALSVTDVPVQPAGLAVLDNAS